jgi:response regulator RpfG family c-di-GMP phosphodiesterase
MISRLPVEQMVKDIQFKIVNKSSKVYEVECNAKCIMKDYQIVGFQLVIRDITVRKKLENDLFESYKKVQSARNATILGLAKLAEYRDADTGAHLERIREYSKILTEDLAKRSEYAGYITPEYIDDIYNSSILHDIGKVGVPDAILLKPGKLTPDEFDIIKRHSALGGDALREVEAKIEGQSFLTLGKEIAYYHHEKWDGTGYPRGLKGDQIPLSARIVALADVYDALTSKRVYKEAFSHQAAKEIIVESSGTHFAPDIVDAFLKNEHEFRRIREELFRDQEDGPALHSVARASR